MAIAKSVCLFLQFVVVFFVAELRRGGLVVRDQEILGSIPATSNPFFIRTCRSDFSWCQCTMKKERRENHLS